ncbi:MAG: helix-turn-helix domain-containing protein [Minisyncoccia bacterium]
MGYVSNKKIEEKTCGSVLRQTREQRGITLEKVSQDLKIIKSLLEAIEKNQYQKLPPPVYLKKIISQYSHYLHLEEKDILDLYQKSNGRHLSSGNEDNLPQNRFHLYHSPIIQFLIVAFRRLLKFTFLIFILGYCLFEVLQFILPAQIILYYPPSNFNTSNPNLVISGKVIRGKILYFQGQEITFDNQGLFQTSLSLNPGMNTLNLKAINALGKETDLTQDVILSN